MSKVIKVVGVLGNAAEIVIAGAVLADIILKIREQFAKKYADYEPLDEPIAA